MSVIDDYLVDPDISLLDKTRMQAQVLVPLVRALRTELGKDKADAIVKRALRDWSKQLLRARSASASKAARDASGRQSRRHGLRSRARKLPSTSCATTTRRWTWT